MTARLLIVDDDDAIRDSLAERFAARGYAVRTASSGEEAVEELRRGVDVVLLDLQLPKGDGFHVLRTMRAEGLPATVVVITAYGTVERAVEAMKEGAYDFLQKPFAPELVEETLRRALERSRLLRENRALRLSLPDAGLVTADPSMEKVAVTARKAAASGATVLLLGESGTGKEVLARSIHAWSERAEGPFVAVNCAALSETLLESELFGHEKGAFTGATVRKEGRLEAARGGTLFLDEIGDTTPAFQVKLLRVLQERTFERVGGNRSIETDLRVVAATNRDLKKLVEEGGFREDLFYRLNVIALTLPPLRERPRDVQALAEAFLAGFAGSAVRLSGAALDALRAYDWPGNARELRNVVERAVVLSEGDEILPADLSPELFESAAAGPGDSFHERVADFRRRVLVEALAESGGNQTRAAEKLGLQRTYLARLVKKYGI